MSLMRAGAENASVSWLTVRMLRYRPLRFSRANFSRIGFEADQQVGGPRLRERPVCRADGTCCFPLHKLSGSEDI